jgi:phage terminase large subunit-like protein
VRKIDGADHYYVFWRHYLPEARIDEPETRHYHGWEKDGWLIKTSGNMIDQNLIEKDILEDANRFKIAESAFDSWGSEGITGTLQTEGMVVLTVPMITKHLSAPMKWIDGLLKDGRIHHNGDPVAAWGVNNVVVKPDHNDNWFPRKPGDRRKKTDPALALILAVGRAHLANPVQSSPYETRGVIAL